MSSVSKSGGARKKLARDRRILSKAAKQQRSALIHKAAERSGIAMVTMPEPEFRAIVSQLKGLTHEIVEAWARRESEEGGMEHVLLQLHQARVALECVGRTVGGAS